MVRKGISYRSIIFHSLWTTLTGILFFTLSTTKRHNFGYIKFFSICGTLLMTLPWIIQLLVTFVVILLYKTKGCNLMWIVQSPKSKENPLANVFTITSSSSSPSSPLPSSQVVKEKDEFEIRIVIGANGTTSPKDGSCATLLEIQGRNNTKLLTNL
ncbi:unnamed protein product [Cochlearia groenlandica]